MPVCPNDEQLELYFAGLCEADSASDLARHVSSCFNCRSWLDEARRDEELLSRLQGVAGRLGAVADRAGQFDQSRDEIRSAGAGFGEAAAVGEVTGFRILRSIGAGGMGRIYEAEQLEPRRRVAIKIVRDGSLADASRLKFFQREIEALARLKHASIAAIHASGVTPDLSPFFAMELVEGVPLSRYAKEKELRLRDRLELFCRVCDAVNYAHQRGVIHRDLKPSNILVEADGTPKVLDFGLARIMDSDSAVQTQEADVGKIRGTLPYMSPEQARGAADQIDTRTDAYSLGVILYELLADRLPFDLKGLALPEAVRVICEQAPPRPGNLVPGLRGDLETIILKSLEKDPAARYQGVAALRDDISNYLSRRPIQARPPSFVYQARKFVSRHKVAAALVVVIAGFTVAFGIVSSVQAARIARERDRAGHERDTAARERDNAARERDKAVKVAKYAQGTLEWFDPANARGPDVTLREVLDQAAQRIDTELADQPDVAASLHVTLGNGYGALGAIVPAETHLRRALDLQRGALGGESPVVATTMVDLARVLRLKDDYAGAEALYTNALEIQKRALGPGDLAVAETLNNFGALRCEQHHYAEAEALMRQALDLHRAHPGADPLDLAAGLGNLGMVMFGQGQFEQAEPLVHEALDIQRKHGGGNPETAKFISNWATMLLHLRHDAAAAEPLMREALAIRRKFFGNDHPIVADSLDNLAHVLQSMKNAAGAEQCKQEADAIRARLKDPSAGR